MARKASMPLSRSFVLATPMAMPAMPPPAAAAPRLSIPGVVVDVVRIEFEYARFVPQYLSSPAVWIGGTLRREGFGAWTGVGVSSESVARGSSGCWGDDLAGRDGNWPAGSGRRGCPL